ncbi:MAG: amino acid adenylation domain-containing protein [Planctomycetales bacterium]|nr:amino acid adenylation domain-containing protein [Planctomycetales bacterium]
MSRSDAQIETSADVLSRLTPVQQRELLKQLLLQKSARQSEFPMSEGQQGLWHAFRRDPKATSFNVFLPTRIRSPLDVQALRRCFNLLAERHASLRTTFSDDGGLLLQKVHPTLPPEFRVSNNIGASDDQIRTQIQSDVQVPFDLTAGPLLRMLVYQRDTDDWITVALTHHIVVDFWSLVVILDEVRRAYPSFATGTTPDLGPPQNNYRQFVDAQKLQLTSPVGLAQQAYWKAASAQAPPVVELPMDRTRPKQFSGRAANIGLQFPSKSAQHLQKLATHAGVTPFAVVHSVLQILIAGFSNQSKFFIGSPFSGRGQREFEQTVGFFVNMLPLLADVSGNPTFLELVSRTQLTLLDALEHEAYPIARIVQDAGVTRDASRSPLFQVSCTYERAHIKQEAGRAGSLFPASQHSWEFGGIQQEVFYVPHPTCHYDLEFVFEQTDTELNGLICFCRDLFDAPSIELIAEYFVALLQSALDNPENRVSDLQWTKPAPSKFATPSVVGLLAEEHKKAEDLPVLGVHGLIQQAAVRDRGATAMRNQSEDIEYGQMLSRALAVAQALQARGIGADDLVPVVAVRGTAAFTAMLGVHLAGAACVPIDADQPAIDMLDLLADTSARVVLATEGQAQRRMQPSCGQAMLLTIEELFSVATSTGWKPANVHSTVLAYVVYTSGSTGRPKGVMIEHGAVCNTLRWRMREVPLTSSDRVLMLLSHQFDAGLCIAWTTLSQGATLVWADQEARIDPDQLIDQILRDGITVLPAVPSLLRVLVSNPRFHQCSGLRYIWTGGEATTPELFADIRSANQAEFWNFYGPSETAIEATAQKVDRGELVRRITIGHAIDNTQVHILDSQQRCLPDLLQGELAISGRGLARGYLNQSQLTQSKFVTISIDGQPRRVYLTGDQCRRLANGEIDFLGRADHQYKIRGYRLELGEIESVLESCQLVARAAVVVTNAGQPNAQMHAFASLDGRRSAKAVLADCSRTADATSGLAANSDSELALSAIHRFLHDRLPAYKVPATLEIIDDMPLTSSGKVDRARLPQPTLGSQTVTLVAPSTAIEEYLAGVWGRLLQVERVGVNQNFFDAGGSSLQAAMLTRQLSDDLGVHIPTALVFDLANISQMATRFVQLHPTVMSRRFGAEAVALQLQLATEPALENTVAMRHPLIASFADERNQQLSILPQPIFMVHPPGGIVVCYRELAKQLAPDHVLLGIKSRGLHGTEDLPADMVSMAADYVDAIRSIQPRGPYILGGWSLGGLVAYEVCHQLRAMGEPLEKLVLLDTAIPETASDLVPERDRTDVGREYGIDLTLEQLGELAPEEQLPFLWEHAKKLGVLHDESPAEVVAQVLNDLQGLFHHHVSVVQSYRMQPLDVAVLLVRPREVPVQHDSSEDRGWGYLVNSVKVSFVPGHHHSMVQPPNVQEVAEAIVGALS